MVFLGTLVRGKMSLMKLTCPHLPDSEAHTDASKDKKLNKEKKEDRGKSEVYIKF